MRFSSDVIVMGLRPKIEHVDVLFDWACVDLFHKIRCSEHCLCSPYVMGQAIIFSSCFFLSFFLLLFFPRLISAVGDWMFTILRHMVWP